MYHTAEIVKTPYYDDGLEAPLLENMAKHPAKIEEN